MSKYDKQMHADEILIDSALARSLLEDQFPELAALVPHQVRSAGTDHVLFRIAEDLVMRLPRVEAAASQTEKEWRWLRRLAPYLSLEVPLPLYMGTPGQGYPSRWSICRWIQGENAFDSPIADLKAAAERLAGFVLELRQIDPAGGPVPGAHNFHRGVPLIDRDMQTRAAIAQLEGLVDTALATRAWESARDAPLWQGSAVWIHGDLHPGNLIVRNGELAGVIDFGGLAVGDAACDLMPAWTLLSADSREVFRRALDVDEASWLRGRGWALSFALIALPYYIGTNPVLATISRHTIEQALEDFATNV